MCSATNLFYNATSRIRKPPPRFPTRAEEEKETWREIFASGKRESIRDWTIIQKGILVVFVLGVTLAIVDMSCGTKPPTPAPTAPKEKLIKE